MKVKRLKIKDAKLILPDIHWDNDRGGYFIESFNKEKYEEAGIEVDWVQDNEVMSKMGVIRGLGMQGGVMSQAKLVRVIDGAVMAVIVDFRRESKTYLKHVSLVLADNMKQILYVPRRCLFGYQVLADHTVVNFKVDNHYAPESEIGIRWDDTDLNIKWFDIEPVLSEKDKELPLLANVI